MNIIHGRIGRMKIDSRMIEKALRGKDKDNYLGLAATMQRFITVKVEPHHTGDFVEYTGYHPSFDVVPEGHPVPEYQVTILLNRPAPGKPVGSVAVKFNKL